MPAIAPGTCLDETGGQIVRELYRAVEFLGGDPCLLGTIGSWGDCLDDKDILANLRSWNEMGECFAPDPAVHKPGKI